MPIVDRGRRGRYQEALERSFTNLLYLDRNATRVGVIIL